MSLQTRLLPADEWPRLTGTELETVWPHLPSTAHVIAVEDGDQIVGCWALFPIVRVEGVWIAPAYRKQGGIARRLLRAMRSTARSMGAVVVETGSLSAEVTALLAALGAKPLPGTQFVLTVGAP